MSKASSSSFVFDYQILESCARETSHFRLESSSRLEFRAEALHFSFLDSNVDLDATNLDSDITTSLTAPSCQELYTAYRTHYQRKAYSEERYRKFQETVQLISSNNNGPNHHRLTLNKFSDEPNGPGLLHNSNNEGDDLTKDPTYGVSDADSEDAKVVMQTSPQVRRRIQQEPSRDYELLSNSTATPLDDNDIEMAIQRRNLAGHHRYHPTTTSKRKTKIQYTIATKQASPPTLSWHHYANNEPFNIVDLPKKGKGIEMDLKPTNHFQKTNNDSKADKFSKSLNWATKNNPDKIPLVHGVFDQGQCGSCWAYAATGSLETSVARRAAHDYYTAALQQNTKTNAKHPRRAARQAARQVELETFKAARLSIQELIDCDTAADQGCIGGNPLLAFYYIRRYGLVPWDEYDYVGHRSSPDNNNEPPSFCQLDKIAHPIVTVDSWGSLPKNHEDMIELALRYIGPVAVAINGADPSFVAYGGGIYDNPTCSQKPNHALLIVGYGEETVADDEDDGGASSSQTIRYWIARNSWGKDWGEDGYIRVKRGPGGEKIKGVCGIARSPSVALGGKFHPNRTTVMVDKFDDPTHQEYPDYSDEEDPIESPICDLLFRQNGLAHLECFELSLAFYRYPAASLGVSSIIVAFFFAVVPLSLQCCRRRRRPRRRLSSLSGSLSSIRSGDSLPSSRQEKMNGTGAGAQTKDERTRLMGVEHNYGGTDETSTKSKPADE